MLFVGYVEGLDAQRAIAWKCADSLSVRTFLSMSQIPAITASARLIRVA